MCGGGGGGAEGCVVVVVVVVLRVNTVRCIAGTHLCTKGCCLITIIEVNRQSKDKYLSAGLL